MNERDYWLGFSVFSGIGPHKFSKLLKTFGSAKKTWHSSEKELASVLGKKLSDQFFGFRIKFSIENYSKKLEKENVWFTTLKENGYPHYLSKINNPPFVLYGKGLKFNKWDKEEIEKTIGIVGARRTTQYGRDVTKFFSSRLTASGFTIVSGLAMGVDAVSHMSALESGGKTIAVLGCGVDCCNPRENFSLYKKIIEGESTIISELPVSHPPNRGSFPQRNRIIAGLSLGVLVTEGGEDSGSLITADYAFKNNRKVFAVPGPITSSLSKGPYKLIQKGAKLVTSAEDILNELKITNSKSQAPNKSQNAKFKTETKEEEEILKILENESLHFDEIVRRSNFDSSKVGSLLSIMEIKGLIKNTDGGFYSIAS